MRVVGRGNNREFHFTVLKNEVWWARMQEMSVTRQRAVGTLAFVAQYAPHTVIGPESEPRPRRIKRLGPKWCPVR